MHAFSNGVQNVDRHRPAYTDCTLCPTEKAIPGFSFKSCSQNAKTKIGIDRREDPAVIELGKCIFIIPISNVKRSLSSSFVS